MHHLINSQIMAGSSLGSLHCGRPKPPINTGAFGNIASLCKAYQTESTNKWNEWRAIHRVHSMTRREAIWRLASEHLSWGILRIVYNGVARRVCTHTWNSYSLLCFVSMAFDAFERISQTTFIRHSSRVQTMFVPTILRKSQKSSIR